jgi:hypothetical protein
MTQSDPILFEVFRPGISDLGKSRQTLVKPPVGLGSRVLFSSQKRILIFKTEKPCDLVLKTNALRGGK